MTLERQNRVIVQQVGTATPAPSTDFIRPVRTGDLHQRPASAFLPLVHTEAVSLSARAVRGLRTAMTSCQRDLLSGLSQVGPLRRRRPAHPWWRSGPSRRNARSRGCRPAEDLQIQVLVGFREQQRGRPGTGSPLLDYIEGGLPRRSASTDRASARIFRCTDTVGWLTVRTRWTLAFTPPRPRGAPLIPRSADRKVRW